MKTTNLIIATAMALGVMSCSDDEPKATSTVSMRASANTSTTTTVGGRYATAVELSEFKINLREIEFEIDDDNIEKTTYKDLKLKGPFEIDLMDANGAALSALIANAEVPNGRYEEVECKIHKGSDPNAFLYNKSVYASGTINGTPFIFWHDTDEEFEIDFSDMSKDIALSGQDLTVTIQFNLGMLFNSSSGIDLSLAEDTNGDGIIEIDPVGERDNNKSLAHDIKQRLEDLTDLMDDHH